MPNKRLKLNMSILLTNAFPKRKRDDHQFFQNVIYAEITNKKKSVKIPFSHKNMCTTILRLFITKTIIKSKNNKTNKQKHQKKKKKTTKKQNSPFSHSERIEENFVEEILHLE
ncbi:hypothetical protein RFI_08218 [Reticulomyxa filosa]|uniref:Uncharacterized protein n=1 Tax=Reticulomyxa filosa TaxID=46433 RepID=X6NT50_RETFI|nr:hypothetical protein RFI_08218 [Reticulomyxa filosa]|eukprot:ETO28909.1 hypothetical protein RFI_08218 [Reticulomyxa filosa]